MNVITNQSLKGKTFTLQNVYGWTDNAFLAFQLNAKAELQLTVNAKKITVY